jgi:hypothetical protein
MGQLLSYMHESFWIVEGAEWSPPEAIILRDKAGAPIGNSLMSTMFLTLYNVVTDEIVNGADGTVSVLPPAHGCTLSSTGVFVLTLLAGDTAIVDPTRTYEHRRALIRYQWPTVPTKADALQIDFIVRNLRRLV